MRAVLVRHGRGPKEGPPRLPPEEAGFVSGPVRSGEQANPADPFR